MKQQLRISKEKDKKEQEEAEEEKLHRPLFWQRPSKEMKQGGRTGSGRTIPEEFCRLHTRHVSVGATIVNRPRRLSTESRVSFQPTSSANCPSRDLPAALLSVPSLSLAELVRLGTALNIQKFLTGSQSQQTGPLSMKSLWAIFLTTRP